MKTTPVMLTIFSWLSLVLSSCATISSSTVASEATSEAFTKSGKTKGVVILSVNWSRRWNCGGYENAEIMSIGFDRLPIKDNSNDNMAEVFIDGPPRLMKNPTFEEYAIILEPGEYALTHVDIKAARSVRNVGHFVAKRSHLMKNGRPKVGSFEINAGEIVYIGNFYLDCYKEPIIWRYYTEGRENFKTHMLEVKQKYLFIEPEKVTYRLFRTTTIGLNYELPKGQ
jgi:hypothetical protein